MYELCNLNKDNLNEFRVLEELRQNFNPLNKHFWDSYLESNSFFQYLLRKKVKLLEYDRTYTGYIWVEGKGNGCLNINSMYSLENVDLIQSYSYLINSVRGNSLITYECEKNHYNFSILERLGFKADKGTIEMEITLENNIQANNPEGVSFHAVTIGRDEELRCIIQNSIFNQEGRIPLKIEDIYYDEIQDYYCNDGAILIKLDKRYIGYGQIIIRYGVPYIVNFGIIPSYQNKGYGKILLTHLLNTVYSKGNDKVQIKVSQNNLPALNLYKSLGFIEISQKTKWYLK